MLPTPTLRALSKALVFVTCLNVSAIAVSQPGSATTVSIETQALSSTLVAIGRTFSITVIASDQLTAGRSAPAIKGEMTVGEALARALADSDLIAESRSPTTYVVREAPSDEATESSSPGIATLEEILVFGTKANQSLQKTATSVEMFTAERIENEVLFTVDDILLRTPNVSTSGIGSRGFSIRGVSSSGVGGVGSGATSQLYIDGAPLNLALIGGVQSVWDLSQVEILRGPQSTIQGRNALSGAILAYTADPSYEWSAKARVQAATEEVLNASFAVGGPIIEDQLAFRVSYDQQELNTGQKEVSTGLDQQFYDIYTARGKLLFEPNALPGLRVELSAQRAKSETGDFNFAFAPVAFDDPAFADFDPFAGETHTRVNFTDMDSDRFIADVRYELNDNLALIGLATYEDTVQERRFNFGLPATIDLPLSPGTATQKIESYEVRAAFDYSRVRGWIGAYYFEERNRNRGGGTFPIAVLGLNPDPLDSLVISTTIGQSRITNDAVFADVTVELTDRWSLNLGARYDRERFGDNPQSGFVTTDPPTCTLGGVVLCSDALAAFTPTEPATPTDYEAFLPRVGIAYQIDADRSLDFTVARGYRAGGISQFFDPTSAMNITNEFDPEFLTNYELAFRSLWLDGRLSLNANLFYTEWEDQQVRVPSAQIDSRLALIENAGESELYGLEMAVNHQVTPELSYFVSLGLLHTEFIDFPFAEVPGPFENIAGNAFNAAPETTVAAGITYAHPSGLYTNWSVNYRSEQFSEVANLAVNEVDDATLVNGRVGYQSSRWNLYAFANNAFDERFATDQQFAVVDSATGEVGPTNVASYGINFGRIAGVALEYEY